MNTTPSPTLFTKGFRPFFLLAGLFAVVIMPLWLLGLFGHIQVGGYWSPWIWHAHEMVYGFVIAVVSGFLLTAVENWTKQTTARGAHLAGLAALWLAGRLVVGFAADLPPVFVACVELSFLPALAITLARPLIKAKNRRNAPFPILLGVLWIANLVQHLGALNVLPEAMVRPALFFALDIILLFVLVIGGRIIPLFTRGGTKAEGIVSHRGSNIVTLASFAALAVATLAGAPGGFVGPLGIIAGAAALVRARNWGVQHTLRIPILWVLHLGHAWIGVGLMMRGVAALAPEVIAASLATHALTVGTVGTLTLGMMARVALGHTGRALKAANPVALAFFVISLAVVVRVFVPMFAMEVWASAIIASGVLWSVAFALFLLVYAPILLKPRADGRPE